MAMMEHTDHKGPISHKVVGEREFERLAAKTVAKDGGKPMVEKTIFIVKPVYIPVEVPMAASTRSGEAPSLIGKKGMKLKKRVQKAIYMERQKAPNYTSSMASAINEKPKRSKKTRM